MSATCETTISPSRRNGRERGLRRAAFEHRRHALYAAPRRALPRDIDISRAGRFEREAHKLAAPLQARPIVELISHRCLWA